MLLESQRANVPLSALLLLSCCLCKHSHDAVCSISESLLRTLSIYCLCKSYIPNIWHPAFPSPFYGLVIAFRIYALPIYKQFRHYSHWCLNLKETHGGFSPGEESTAILENIKWSGKKWILPMWSVLGPRFCGFKITQNKTSNSFLYSSH